MSKTKKHILLVEDDRNFGEVLKSYLEMDGYLVTWEKEGESGLRAFKSGQFDLCVLDVMMPIMDGITLAKEIRFSNQLIPIIFLTAKGLKDDVLKGYKSGADDYINKPFDSEVLLYKIKALLKRGVSGRTQLPDVFEFEIGEFHFNYKLRFIKRDGQSQKLSPKEAELLLMLCQHMDDVLPRELALKQIWQDDNYFTTRSMDVYVAKLRKYLKADPALKIANVHGAGFQLQTGAKAAD